MEKKDSNISYYFDIGSSTIKLYQYQEKKTKLIEEKSILFKAFFSKETGISNKNYISLITFIKEMKEKYHLSKENTKIIATGIWRNIPKQQLETIKADFYSMDLIFCVISHEEESFYFAKAMQGIYDRKKVLMVNMGGKTTELIVYDKGNVTNKKNLEIGVADVLNYFPKINQLEEKHTVEEVVTKIREILPREKWEKDITCAIHTGGELRFQMLAKYNLVENTIFQDPKHPFMLQIEDFKKRNRQLVEETQMQELYQLMPKNPSWMDGAKAGVCLAEAIFDWLAINWIIPSDLNIIDGVVKVEGK